MLNALRFDALRFDAPRSPFRIGLAVLLLVTGGLKGLALLQGDFDPFSGLRPQQQAVIAEFEVLLALWLLWGAYSCGSWLRARSTITYRN